jgi:hypothetical protein
MKKKITFILFTIVSLLLASNAYAGIVETLSGGVDVYQKFIEARHWAAFMAAGVLIAIFRALPNLKTPKFKITAIGRAFLMFVAGFFCVFLMIYEWWPAIVIVLGAIFDAMRWIFEFTNELFFEFFEYITD